MSADLLDPVTLTMPEQGAALLAFVVQRDSTRERAAWLELHQQLPDAAAVLDAVLALPHAQRMPLWETLAASMARSPLETRQELVADARELLRVGGRISVLRKMMWVALRHVLASPPQRAAVAPLLPQRLDVAQSLAACCYAAWLSQMVPQPELTLDLSAATSANERWWLAVTAGWQTLHGEKALRLPRREGVDADLALRSLKLLQSLPPEHAAGLLHQWTDAALTMVGGPLHPEACDVLRVSARLLGVALPSGLRQAYDDGDAAVWSPSEDDEATVPVPTARPMPPAPPAPPRVSAPVPLAAPATIARASPGASAGPVSAPGVLARPVVSPRPVTPPPPPPPSSPAIAPAKAAPPPAEPPRLEYPSAMERPFSAESRPAEVAFVFKASLLHLPGDPDYPHAAPPAPPAPDGSTDAQAEPPVPPSPPPFKPSR